MKKQLVLLSFVFTLIPITSIFSNFTEPTDPIEIFFQRNDFQFNSSENAALLTVSGFVRDAQGNPLKNVEVCLDANLIEYPRCRETDELGFYSFLNVTENVDYELTANYDEDHLNGVSTLDFVMIWRHLLDFQKIESPYGLIAADANADNRISILDLRDLRKVILGAYGEFPTNQSYRFVDASYTFPDESNPWPEEDNVPYVIRFNPSVDTTHDFIGIKTGDVSFH